MIFYEDVKKESRSEGDGSRGLSGDYTLTVFEIRHTPLLKKKKKNS